MRLSPQVHEPVVTRGEVYWADLGKRRGSEMKGRHPVLIIQNDLGNKYSPTTIVATLTSKLKVKTGRLHVRVSQQSSGLAKASMVLAEQLVTLDKEKRLGKRIGKLSDAEMAQVDSAVRRSLDIQ